MDRGVSDDQQRPQRDPNACEELWLERWLIPDEALGPSILGVSLPLAGRRRALAIGIFIAPHARPNLLSHSRQRCAGEKVFMIYRGQIIKETKNEKLEAVPPRCRLDRSGDCLQSQDGEREHVVRSMRCRRRLHLLLPVRWIRAGLLRQALPLAKR